MNNVINSVMAAVIGFLMYSYCNVPVEIAVQTSFLALIAYSLQDISREMKK